MVLTQELGTPPTGFGSVPLLALRMLHATRLPAAATVAALDVLGSQLLPHPL